MATNVTCDNCGSDRDAFRVTVDFSTNGGEKMKGSVPRFDCDLCLTCFGRVTEIMRQVMPPKAAYIR